MRTLFLILALICVTASQTAWVFFVWPAKIASVWTIVLLPFFVVFAAHGYLYHRCLRYYRALSGPRLAGLLAISFLTAFLSLWISMLPAVNTYGT